MTRTARRHPRPAAVLVTGGAVTALVGSFLPWLQSGGRSRSSYQLFQIVDRLGFGNGRAAVEWVFRLWPLVPFTVALIVTLQWWHPTTLLRRLGAVVLPAICAVAIGGVAVALIVAPDISLFRIGSGPIVTAIGGVLMLVGASAGLFARRHSLATP